MPTILLVEDDVQQSHLFAEILRLNGLSVVEAGDGFSAIDASQQHTFDAIVLDLMLPNMSGLQLTKILKRQPQTKDVPIIAISGQAASSAPNDALAAGCATYFKKPYSPMALVAEIKHWVNAAQIIRSLE